MTSIEDFEARVGSVLVGKGEPANLFNDLQKFSEEADPEQKTRISELIKLVLEHRMLTKIKSTLAKMVGFLAGKKSPLTTDERMEHLTVCCECVTMTGDIEYWVETFGEDYSFIVMAAIRSIQEHTDDFVQLGMD